MTFAYSVLGNIVVLVVVNAQTSSKTSTQSLQEISTTRTLQATSEDRLVTTEIIFDDIARFITNDPSATYDSTTSTTFADLFSCIDTDGLFSSSQDGAWTGFTRYADIYFNEIILRNSVDGTIIKTVDEWGGRCFVDPAGVGGLECEDPSEGFGWLECIDEDTCVPHLLPVRSQDGSSLSIEIYEPCNFVSNLA